MASSASTAYYAPRLARYADTSERLHVERSAPAPGATVPSRSFREQKARALARDYGCFFCVVCDEPVRGVVCYKAGAACHFGCSGTETGDLQTLEALQPCQDRALRNVREATRHLHEEALPRLRARMGALGLAPEDADVTLAWIRDEAPIIIHVDLAAFGSQLAADSHYRNQFETHSSRGSLCHASRTQWEANLFGDAYDDALPVDRCKYGVLNVTSDPQGVSACHGYGTSYLLLKNVRLRTTFAARDSAGAQITEIATVDYYAHVLDKYSDDELRAAVEVAARRAFGRDSLVIQEYKEAQIHGEVNLAENVELIMVHPSLRTERRRAMLKALSDRCNAPIIWMEGGQGGQDDGDSPRRDIYDSPGSRAPTASEHDEELLRAVDASRAEAARLSAAKEDELARSLAAEERDLARAIEASRVVAAECPPHLSSEEEELALALEVSRLEVATTEPARGLCDLPADADRLPPAMDDGDFEEEMAAAIRASLQEAEEKKQRESLEQESALRAVEKRYAALAEHHALSSELAPEPDETEIQESPLQHFDMTEGQQTEDESLWGLFLERLHAQSLELEDLPSFNNDAEFNELLAELGFTSALKRAKLRKLAKALCKERLDVRGSSMHAVGEVNSGWEVSHILTVSLGEDTRCLSVSWPAEAEAHEVLRAISDAVFQAFDLIPGKFLLNYTTEDGGLSCLDASSVLAFLEQHGKLCVVV